MMVLLQALVHQACLVSPVQLMEALAVQAQAQVVAVVKEIFKIWM